MLDVWAQNDLPVLAELVRRLEVDGVHRVDTPLAVGDLSDTRVQAALRRLEVGHCIVGVATHMPYPVIITGVTQLALRAVQAWPSPKGSSNDCSSL